MNFTLYSRSYCHLCDDMLNALRALLDCECGYVIEVLDVDGDEALVALYDELVPVLFGIKNGQPAVQLCHYFLDEAQVKKFISTP